MSRRLTRKISRAAGVVPPIDELKTATETARMSRGARISNSVTGTLRGSHFAVPSGPNVALVQIGGLYEIIVI